MYGKTRNNRICHYYYFSWAHMYPISVDMKISFDIFHIDKRYFESLHPHMFFSPKNVELLSVFHTFNLLLFTPIKMFNCPTMFLKEDI